MRKSPVSITNGLVNDMRILRSQGKTNREIAQEMGLCIATVRRHIGNQPSGLRANYGSVIAHVTDVEVQPPPYYCRQEILFAYGGANENHGRGSLPFHHGQLWQHYHRHKRPGRKDSSEQGRHGTFYHRIDGCLH